MTTDDLLDGLLAREGGFRDVPWDRGGPTNYGITAHTLGNWRGLRRPATAAEVRALTRDEARRIYVALYVEQPGFIPGRIPFDPLRAQMVDFGVNSGPERAIRWLQRVLRITASGAMDVVTVQRLHDLHAFNLLPLVNDALVGARAYMVDRSADAGIIGKQDEEGVESRALSFLLCASPADPAVTT